MFHFYGLVGETFTNAAMSRVFDLCAFKIPNVLISTQAHEVVF